MKEYYKILGVSEAASQEEIKKAYRNLAKQHHPDHGGDSELFKKVSEAYETLGDEQKRRQYDQGGNQNPFHGMGGMDPGSAFEAMFSNIFRHSHRRTDLDIQVEVNLTFKEVYTGTSKSVSFNRKTICNACSGAGGATTKCETCKGSGTVARNVGGGVVFSSTCHTCQGRRMSVDRSRPCTPCKGSGFHAQSVTENITIPPGAGHIHQSIVMTMHNAGNRDGNSQGDLQIVINVVRQNKFIQDGLNVITTQPVKFTDLCLGSSLPITLPDDSQITLNLSPGTSLDKVQRIKSKGLKQPNTSIRGDFLIQLDLQVPSHVTKDQKELLEKLISAGL